MDLMLAVYHDMSYFLELDYEDCWRLIEKAEERLRTERNWLAYVSWIPHMEEEKRCTFEEFNRIKKAKISMKSSADIIKDGNKLKKIFDKPKS